MPSWLKHEIRTAQKQVCTKMEFKFPRTFHLPWSPGATSDDKILKNVNCFVGKSVVVTEKLDGENTTMRRDRVHARSLTSSHHPSRDHVKVLHATIKQDIPEDWRVCGENVYAEHSIFYNQLTAYFYVFAIFDEKNICLSWQDTKSYADMLGLKTVPEIYSGDWNEESIKNCMTGISTLGGLQEGYVVRNQATFHYDDYDKNAAKFVRENHVQTDIHWMQKVVVPNILKK